MPKVAHSARFARSVRNKGFIKEEKSFLEVLSTRKEKLKEGKSDIFIVEEKKKDADTFQFSPEETQMVNTFSHFNM